MSIRTALLSLAALGVCACEPDSSCKNSRNHSAESCIDVVVVTVIAEEYRAMLGKLDTRPIRPDCSECTNRYSWVSANVKPADSATPYRVVVGMAGEAGTTAGAIAVHRAISRFRPRHVLLVGVAGGIPGRIEHGDVILAESIWGYDYGAIDQQFRPRLDFTFRADPRLLQAAQAVTSRWQDDIRAESPDPQRSPVLLTGQMGSGNKVIEFMDSEFVEHVMQVNSAIAGVEMEGAGAAAAVEDAHAHGIDVGFLMIRGISDLPEKTSGVLRDKDDRELWKAYAADAAASYTLGLLRHGWPDAPR